MMTRARDHEPRRDDRPAVRAGSGQRPAVWAPAATQVDLLVEASDGRADPVARPMTPDAAGSGWWFGDDPLAPGTAYRFVLDGDPLPDPRSRWQPAGVHGPSVVVDHDAFEWHDQGWRAPPLSAAVIYELHIGTFTPDGTYAAAAERLHDLVELGVTHLELMPLATFDGDHGWGYDGVDLFAPHPRYGTPDELKAFVDRCHRLGLAVLIDVVYNHLGPAGNHLGRFGPYFTDRFGTPWGEAVNLDGAGSGPVRQLIIENATMWLRDYHADGLRLDAVHALLDTSACHLLEELAGAVDDLAATLGRPLVLIAESDANDPRLVRDRAVGGYGLDAHWCDDVHHAIHTVLTGDADGYYADYAAVDGLAVLERALSCGYVYDGRYSPARDRVVGRPIDGLRGRQLVACIQNHDQIGNRAGGERLSHLTSIDAQQVAAALLLTSPFVPLLFQGEEWAASTPFPYFADHQDPALVEAVRRGRRAEFAAFGWEPDDVTDPEDPATLALARLRWDERELGAHAETLRWYRDLIALRRATPSLLDDRLGTTLVQVDAERRTVMVHRGELVVLANLDRTAHRIADVGRDVVLASKPVTEAGDALVLPALAAAIVRAPA